MVVRGKHRSHKGGALTGNCA